MPIGLTSDMPKSWMAVSGLQQFWGMLIGGVVILPWKVMTAKLSACMKHARSELPPTKASFADRSALFVLDEATHQSLIQ